MILVSPSLLAADFAHLGAACDAMQAAGADWMHFDVMDGLFVPNLSFGLPVLSSLSAYSTLPMDVHLMIQEPHRYIEQFAKEGAHCITVHVEAESDLPGTLKAIRALGVLPAVCIKPGTPAEAAFPYLELVDMVLVMSVEPGFGGQKFMPVAIDKIAALRQECDRRGLHDMHIEVDGGITAETAPLVVAAGADVLVAGSALFRADDPAAMMAQFKALA